MVIANYSSDGQKAVKKIKKIERNAICYKELEPSVHCKRNLLSWEVEIYEYIK